MTAIQRAIENALEAAYVVPDHIAACASAIRYDLYHGPSFSRIPASGIEAFTVDDYATDYESLEDDLAEHGGKIVETYTGLVAETLRAWIDDLPSELWFDSMAECLQDCEPEGFDEDGEWIEPDYSDYYRLDRDDIILGLLGKTISREFN